MITVKCVIIAITILPFAVWAKAEVNHWQVLKQYMIEDTPEAGAKFKDYIEALSTDELIIAARQCSDEMQTSIDPNDWDVAVGNLGFFYMEYPKKTNNLKDISSLLKDLKDRSQSIFWRRAIMELLEGSLWHGKLNEKQRFDSAKIMYEIYSDDSEHMLLKPKAIRNSTQLLRSVYSANLEDDPNTAIKANEKILAEISRAITTQISMFSNKTTDPAIQESIIVVWARYNESNLAPLQVQQTLSNAVDNYKDYDERLWKLIILPKNWAHN
jgi:hypothetical protein